MLVRYCVYLITVTAFLAGCSTSISGPGYVEVYQTFPKLKPGYGRIFFYRESGFYGGGIRPAVHINGQPIKLENDKWGRSAPGGFFFVDRLAGEYKIYYSYVRSQTILVKLAAGERVYIKSVAKPPGFFTFGGWTPLQVPAHYGKNEVHKLKYQGREVSLK